MAAFADTIRPLWLLNRNYLFEEEARAAIWEWCGTTVESVWSPEDRLGWSSGGVSGQGTYRFCPFRKSPLEAFRQARVSPPLDESSSRPFGLRALIETFDEAPEIPSALLQLHQAYAESQPASRAATPLFSGGESFVRYLFQNVCRNFGSGAREAVQQLARSLDLRTCPALYTYLQIRAAIHRDTAAGPAPSEMVDVVHVAALPYVDAFSTDKRIVDYIRRSKVGFDIFRSDRVRAMKPFRLLEPALEWLEQASKGSA